MNFGHLLIDKFSIPFHCGNVRNHDFVPYYSGSVGQVSGTNLGIWLYTFGKSWPYPIIGALLLLVIVMVVPRLKSRNTINK